MSYPMPPLTSPTAMPAAPMPSADPTLPQDDAPAQQAARAAQLIATDQAARDAQRCRSFRARGSWRHSAPVTGYSQAGEGGLTGSCKPSTRSP